MSSEVEQAAHRLGKRSHKFLRLLLIHPLPGGVLRTRHFGLFANRMSTPNFRTAAPKQAEDASGLSRASISARTRHFDFSWQWRRLAFHLTACKIEDHLWLIGSVGNVGCLLRDDQAYDDARENCKQRDTETRGPDAASHRERERRR